MLKGRLGLATARIPHKDRHGLVWLSRGALVVEDGTLHFVRKAEPTLHDPLKSGDYAIPFQMVSMILLGPGSTVSHDALRLCARHGTALVAVGEDGVRAYTAPPLIPDRSGLARRQARVWADADGTRLDIARRMYAWRLGEILPHKDIATLRGIEGARVKAMYKLQAERFSIRWEGRRYDRANPNAADLPNQALNHAASAVEAAAAIADTIAASNSPSKIAADCRVGPIRSARAISKPPMAAGIANVVQIGIRPGAPNASVIRARGAIARGNHSRRRSRIQRSEQNSPITAQHQPARCTIIFQVPTRFAEAASTS